mmetsp:Transcript_27114/g.83269  ORF Transcript_27114/g.83269 Transcript_27114/m.83269 type:complete len:229 (+) Transcript_27114:108-794(+)
MTSFEVDRTRRLAPPAMASYEDFCVAQKRSRRSRPRVLDARQKEAMAHQKKGKWHPPRRTRRGGRGRARRLNNNKNNNNANDGEAKKKNAIGLVFLQDYVSECPVALLPSGQLVEVLPTAHNLAGATLFAPRSPVSADETSVDERAVSQHSFGQRALEEAVATCLEHDDDDNSSCDSSSSCGASSYGDLDDHRHDADDEPVVFAAHTLFAFLDDDDDHVSVASSLGNE